MRLLAVKKSIKALKTMRAFYKENPSMLRTQSYSDCAMGTYMRKVLDKRLFSIDVREIMSETFGICDLYDFTRSEASKFNDPLEKAIIHLFLDQRVIHSNVWRKQAKDVIKALKDEKKQIIESAGN